MNITIGSDPEFGIAKRRNNQTIFYPPKQYLGDSLDYLGTDHGGKVLELRPPQANDPLTHANTIHDLLLRYRAYRRRLYTFDFCPFVFPGTGLPSVGGHIHIGYPTYSNKYEILRDNLSSYLALPFAYVQNPKFEKYRKSLGYGHLGDIRGQDWGLEYRTLSCWLGSRKLTESVLSLAYTIADETLNHNLIGGALGNRITTYFNQHELNPIYADMKKGVERISGFTLYPTYKPQIDYLLEHALSKTVIGDTEIKHGWLIPYTKVRRIVFDTLAELSEKFGSILAQNTIDQVPETIQFSYGSDSTRDIVSWLNRILTQIYMEKIDSLPDFCPIEVLRSKLDDEVEVRYNEIPSKRMRKFERILTDYVNQFRPNTHIKMVKIEQGRFLEGTRMTIFVPRNSHTIFGMTVSFLGLMYLNNIIRRTFRWSRRTGKKITIRELTRQIVKPLIVPRAQEDEARYRKSTMTEKISKTERMSHIDINDVAQWANEYNISFDITEPTHGTESGGRR